MDWYVFQFDGQFLLTVVVRLLVACILGGIIGIEREYSRNKPAGFRTHILVSLGSCLVMLISQFTFMGYEGMVNVDPTRLGAQVVSGIGFLGAGAIIRHGSSVKGITTAASIWVVACVGLACGVGFYVGAAIATLLIWAVLTYLKLIEDRLTSKEKTKMLEIEAQAESEIILPLSDIFKDLGLIIKSIDFAEDTNDHTQKILCQLTGKKSFDFALLTAKVKEIEGVLKISI